jgi:hypothetical protein
MNGIKQRFWWDEGLAERVGFVPSAASVRERREA